jgi:hypothetical protein
VGVVEVDAGAVLDGADEDVDVGAADDFEDALSTGNDSPGLKSMVAFFAYAFWIASVCVSFYNSSVIIRSGRAVLTGLMTPTIPSSMHAPGAEQ